MVLILTLRLFFFSIWRLELRCHPNRRWIWRFLSQLTSSKTNENRKLFHNLPNVRGRWITVAGEENEEVLFCTFIDAAIGGKKRHVRSKGALYMVILSAQHGESEARVTLCNQSGSLGVTRDLTIDDLLESTGPTSLISGMSPVRGVQSYGLEFPSLQVAVGFTNEKDLQRFRSIPQAYFTAVMRCEPRELIHPTEIAFQGLCRDCGTSPTIVDSSRE